MIVVGALQIDEPRNRAHLRGREVPLRPLDLRVLAKLASSADRALTREALTEALWGPEAEIDSRSVDACVTRIRRALNGDGDCIVTVRRIGYRLDPSVLV